MRWKLIIIIVVLIALAMLSFFVLPKLYRSSSRGNLPVTGIPSTSALRNLNGPATTSAELQELAQIPVPEMDTKNAAENVAVPENVTTNASTNSNIRGFGVRIRNGLFVPDTVIVRQWDTVLISLASEDADYQLIQPDYGMKPAVLKGTTTTIEFSASAPGQYYFYCQNCANPKEVVGSLVVTPK
ncbi:MAG: cupredoxin domain-containing protein [Candidatus Liptonbacteria bacterium]|nr:cupredoxin domain-containing protein [Candidatus Liptonbacteria bacterium]